MEKIGIGSQRLANEITIINGKYQCQLGVFESLLHPRHQADSFLYQ